MSDTLNRIVYKDDRFIIERNGKPAAALVSIEDYQLIAQLRAGSDERRLEARRASHHVLDYSDAHDG